MIDLDIDILDEFQARTQQDLRSFLIHVQSFIKNDRLRIIRYYNGEATKIDTLAFQNFESLKKQLQNIFQTYQTQSHTFANSKWWDLLDSLELIDNVFNNLQNTHRWSRSSISKFGYHTNVQIDYTLAENQTLERVSQDILSQDDPNNDWYNIAIDNDLTEEEYTTEGGVSMKLSYPRSNKTLQLNSVMDVMIGKKIYGIDLHRKLTFATQNQDTDLNILSHDQTIKQAVDILIKLKRNSNPDRPFQGLQTNLIVGGNRALFNFPIIIRQLSEVFSTDDTLQNFTVQNIEFDQDNLSASYQVETRLSESFKEDTIL